MSRTSRRPPRSAPPVLSLVCRVCRLERRTGDFTDRQRQSIWPQCRTCARKRWREYRSRQGAGFVRAENLKQFYGLSVDDVRDMPVKQGNRCPICEETLGESDEDIAIDHCYRTGLIRDLLLLPCNGGLGQFRDDPDRLRRAALYVERSELRLQDPNARFIPPDRLGRRPGT